jgi:hypothetical protein
MCAEVRGPKSHVAKAKSKKAKPKLYDHRPLALGNDNYLRVLQIPKKKVWQDTYMLRFHLRQDIPLNLTSPIPGS